MSESTNLRFTNQKTPTFKDENINWDKLLQQQNQQNLDIKLQPKTSIKYKSSNTIKFDKNIQKNKIQNRKKNVMIQQSHNKKQDQIIQQIKQTNKQFNTSNNKGEPAIAPIPKINSDSQKDNDIKRQLSVFEQLDYENTYTQEQPYDQLSFNNNFLSYYHSPYTDLSFNPTAQTPSSDLDHQAFLQELQSVILTQIKFMESKELKDNYILEHLTDDLDIEQEQLQTKIKTQKISPQQLLKIRMHIQAICKIMVFIHGKSEFRLVQAHFYIGEAYRLNQCYQQAIDHFTIALKKNAKLTQIKQTKIYHSFILTSLSQCYLQLQMQADSLQILLRAYQIQQCYVNSQLKINNIKTIKLISQCYLKLRNFRQAIQYMQKICTIVQRLKGNLSKEYASVKFEKAVIVGQEERNLPSAIQQVKAAIQLINGNSNLSELQKDTLILTYKKKLAQFLQKYGDLESQIKCLTQMLKIIEQRMNTKKKSPKNVQDGLKKGFLLTDAIIIKKKIIVIAIKQSDFQLALNQLEGILTLEQQKYGPHSVCVHKSLKMLSLVHLHLGNQKHSQQYLKKCAKLSSQIQQKKSKRNSGQKLPNFIINTQKINFMNYINFNNLIF